MRLPQKRIYGEAKKSSKEDTSSLTSKKRKLESSAPIGSSFYSSQNGPSRKIGSSQPSHFETEVLEKMTQDIVELKKSNSEKDQQWARPSLKGFNPDIDNLCFQQIECEEGTIHSDKATVQLFGITQVSLSIST